MPSRSVFATNKIPSELIKTDLKSIEYISAFLRTSPDRAVTLSVSFISSKWELECRTLALNANPTADNVGQWISEILEEFNIPMEKISCMTTDSNSKFVEAVKGLGICQITCLTHVVNEFIEDVFSLKDIVVIMEKVDMVFNELECSMLAQSELFSAQKELSVSHDKFLSYSKYRCWSKLNRMAFVRTNEMAFRKFLTTYEGGKYLNLLLTTSKQGQYHNLA